MIGEILATKSGGGGEEDLPQWLSRAIYGGLQQVEALGVFYGRYVFVARNRGGNFVALSRWAENLTVFHDFPRLAAARIEDRLVSEAELFPDDEYGDFFAKLIRLASNRQYPQAVLEDVYWVKTRVTIEADYYSFPPVQAQELEVYEFFAMLSIDRPSMQEHVRDMMSSAAAATQANRFQRAAINRVQGNFFEGF